MPPVIPRREIQPVTARHFHKSAVEVSEARCSRRARRMALSGAGDEAGGCREGRERKWKGGGEEGRVIEERWKEEVSEEGIFSV